MSLNFPEKKWMSAVFILRKVDMLELHAFHKQHYAKYDLPWDMN